MAFTRQTINLAVNDKLYINDQAHRIYQVVGNEYSIQSERSNVIHMMPEKDIIKGIYEQGNIILAKQKYKSASNNNEQFELEAFPKKTIEKMQHRLENCEILYAEYQSDVLPKSAEGFWGKYRKKTAGRVDSLRTVRSYYKKWVQSDRNCAVLISRDWNKGCSGCKILDEQETLIEEVVQDIYLQRHRPNYKVVHEVLCLYIDNHNANVVPGERLTVPSKSTLTRRINRVDPYKRAIKRMGKKQADADFEAFCEDPRWGRATRPLEYVQMDHHKFDLMIKLEDGTCRRPWLTLMLCQFTKMVVGFWISFNQPGEAEALMCMRNALKPKGNLLAEYPDIRSAWPAHGRIENLVLDNGPEFYGQSFVNAANLFGINLLYCEAYKPYQKGSVERLFRTFNDQFVHNLPGTTKSNPLKKGPYYDPRDYAQLSFDELLYKFTKYLVGYYHCDFHRSTAKTPLDAWNDGVAMEPVMLPNHTDKIDKITCVAVKGKPIWQEGILINDNSYWSPELKAIYGRDPDQKLLIKWDPADNGFIWVLDQDKQLIKIPVRENNDLVHMRVDVAKETLRARRAIAERQENKVSKLEAVQSYVDIVLEDKSTKVGSHSAPTTSMPQNTPSDLSDAEMLGDYFDWDEMGEA